MKYQDLFSLKNKKVKILGCCLLQILLDALRVKKTNLDISCESSAKQTIHMKYQDLFSLKNKKVKILGCRLLQILLGALRVN